MPGNIEAIFGRAFTLADVPAERPIALQLADYMSEVGLSPPEDFIFDGEIHRFGIGSSNDAGWYVAYEDGIPAAAFGNWKESVTHKWHAKQSRPLTMLEDAEIKRRMELAIAKRNEERAKKNIVAASSAMHIWDGAIAASPDHPYLARKQVQPHGTKVTGDGRLIIPMYSPNGTLASLEYIDGDGDKKYHLGGATKGAWWVIGQEDSPKRIYFAEGFATAASVYEAVNQMTVVCFSAGNLEPVVSRFREEYPTTTFIISADNDVSKAGEEAARKAATASGAQVVMPPIVGMDANDYAVAGHDLASLLSAQKQEWLQPMSELVRQPEPIRWLIDKWLPSESFVMVHGQAASGKTFLVLDWCMRSTYESQWQGKRVRKGNVIYLAGEGHKGLRKRIAGWLAYYGKPPSDTFHMSKSGTNLDKPEGLQQAIDSIRAIEINPDLIVVDTLHRFYTGNENDAKDAGEMIRSCATLMQEFKCSVLLVHHTGVNAEAQHRGRGSSAWRAALDVEVSVKKDGRSIVATCAKMKDDEEPAPEYLAMELIDVPGWVNDRGEQEGTAILVPGERPEPKENTALHEAQNAFEQAWRNTGEERKEGSPYLTRSGWTAFEREREQTKSYDARKKEAQRRVRKWSEILIADSFIEESEAGFTVKMLWFDSGTRGHSGDN